MNESQVDLKYRFEQEKLVCDNVTKAPTGKSSSLPAAKKLFPLLSKVTKSQETKWLLLNEKTTFNSV